MKFKKIFTSLVALAVISTSVCFMGCGSNAENKDGNKSKDAQVTKTNIKEGGTFVMAIGGNPRTLNPLYGNDRSTMTINNALYSPLFLIDKNNKYQYYLADSLNHSNDFLTYTLHLKKNLKWHDGKPITADDVVFTMDKILDKSQNSLLRAGFIYGNKPVQYKKIDDLTVEFKLPEVNTSFPSYIGSICPIPKHVFEGVKNIAQSDKNNNPIGSGPYKFVSFKKGESVTLEKNDDYVLGKPHIDKVVFRVAGDSNSIVTAFLSGELNAVYSSPFNLDKYKDKAQMVKFDEGMNNNIIMMFNNPYLAKKEVRQAISYALDKKKLLEISNKSTEYATEAYSMFTPDVPQFTNDVEKYTMDINKSKNLLKQAKAENITLRLSYVTGDKGTEGQALLVQQELKDVGINIKLVPMERNAFFEKLFNPKSNTAFDMAFNGYVMGSDPSAYASVFETGGDNNFVGYSNKIVDKLWKDAIVQTNDQKRNEMYVELQKKIAQDAPIYPISYPKSIVMLTKNIGGVKEAQPAPIYMFQDLSKLYFTK